MPKKHVAEVLHVISLEGLLSRHELKHLRVRRHAVLLVIESGPKDTPVPHARFRRVVGIAFSQRRGERMGACLRIFAGA